MLNPGNSKQQGPGINPILIAGYQKKLFSQTPEGPQGAGCHGLLVTDLGSCGYWGKEEAPGIILNQEVRIDAEAFKTKQQSFILSSKTHCQAYGFQNAGSAVQGFCFYFFKYKCCCVNSLFCRTVTINSDKKWYSREIMTPISP